jgi:antitoxin (DNA-binding transcriptional repressor) of toxin-antitoxin stability system
VHEVKTKLSQWLKAVECGEEVILCRDGRPVAKLIPLNTEGLVVGAGVGDPNANPTAGNGWWQAMTDEEADTFSNGK